jgi:hypothetical protein
MVQGVPTIGGTPVFDPIAGNSTIKLIAGKRSDFPHGR